MPARGCGARRFEDSGQQDDRHDGQRGGEAECRGCADPANEEAAQLAQKMSVAPAGGNISSTDFIIILLVIILVAILL